MRYRAIIIGAGLLALAGCGRGGGTETQAGNVNVRATPGDITISTPNGVAQIHTGTGTAALPEGIPAYPNAEAGQSMDVSGASAQGQGHVVSFGTHDSPAQVIDFYVRAAGGAGYQIVNQMNMGATATLTARKGEGQAVNVVATQAGGATQVQIVVADGTR
ncbi:MAG: hypothetical protein JO276_11555 [Sphingomonadaceae bacterium]|nr:hypothetical protein [Sphingomonadaceae bacterium]